LRSYARRLLTWPEVKHGLRLAAVVLVVVLGAQLLYPRGRAQPFASLGGRKVNFKTQDAVRRRLAELEAQPFAVQAGEARLTTSFSDLGTDIDEESAANRVTDYPLPKRLIPFSLLWPVRVREIPLRHDDKKLDAFARQVSDKASRQPQDATIRRTGDKYEVSNSKAGILFAPEQTVAVLRSLSTVPPAEIGLEGEVKKPVFSSDDFQQVLAEREQLITRPLRLQVADYDQPVAPAVLASWIEVGANPGKRKVELTFNQPLITEYLKDISNRVGAPPTPTTVRLRDNKELGRTKGRPGQAIPPQPAIEAIIAALRDGSLQATLPLESVPSPLVYERSYTRSSRGLQLLLEAWQQSNSGASVGVVMEALDGTGLAARVNADKSFFAASMYKLYLSQYLLHGFEEGTSDPNAPVGDTGKTAAQCVEAMIVQSDNACPEALIAQISSRTLNNYVKAQGFPGTVFLSNGTNGTAADTASFLRRLQAGELLDKSNTALLLGYMSRQIYRGALPAGSAPSGVADKVGFYGSVWHDAGIVYHPRGAYVLAVYTENASAAAIKDLAQRINDFMNS